MFVTNWNSTTKIQKISEITNFFRHYFLSRTEVDYEITLQVFADLEGYFVLIKFGFMKEIDSVFLQYYRPLCLYATHYLHDIDEAEDVVQDCFVKLISRSIMPDNIKTFLYTSVRNACIDRLRRQSPIDTEISPSDLSGAISDNQAQESSFREAELWTAIEQLPERCREIFLMSKRDGMTYREIAEELNLSEKTVEHQISKALKTLRGKKDDFLADFFYILPFIHGGIL